MAVVGPPPDACLKVIEQCDATFALFSNATVLDTILRKISDGVAQQTAELADEFRTSGRELGTALQFLTNLGLLCLGLLASNTALLLIAGAVYTQQKHTRLAARDMPIVAT